MVRMTLSQGVDMGSIPVQATIFAGRAAVLVLRTDFQSVDTSSILVRPATELSVAASSTLADVITLRVFMRRNRGSYLSYTEVPKSVSD